MPSQNLKPVGVLSGIAGLLSFSVLAGVLVTAMVTPALAVTSMTANASIGVFESLPEYMEISQLSQKNVLYGIRGDDYVPFAEVYKQNREEVSWEQVSPLIKEALVAGEDRRFYEHGGVDAQSLIRAAIGNLASNEIGSGASTLAMQLVKNINIQEAVLIPDKAERDKELEAAQAKTLDRKLKEAKLAIGLEKKYTKNQIMLAYLNITGFGGNTYGVQSAAKQYYGKTAADVTLAEAASLVAIVQLPNDRNLDDPEKYAFNKDRRDTILNNMLELKMVTQAQYDEAVNTPVEDYVHYNTPTSGCTYALNAKTFCDYILKSVKDFPMLGTNETERQANWDRGGYKVYTTIDLNQQDNAQAQLATYAPATESRFQLGAAVASVQVGTGRIVVMAQNKLFDDTGEGDPLTTTAVNFNTDRAYGGSSGFPAASTYKIFTLTDWLMKGRGLNEVLSATPQVWKHFKAACVPDGGYNVNYKPANDAGEQGPWTVLRGTARSVNGIFMAMGAQLDQCDIRDVAVSMGMHRADGAPVLTDPSAILGVNEVAPMTMAAAIATIGGGGIYCAPIAVDRIVDANGVDLGGQPKDCRQAIPADVAAAAAYGLKAVMDGGGTGNPSNPGNGTPLIGKSGTDDDGDHTWVISSSTNISMAVWVGNIEGRQSLRNINVDGVFGASIRHRIGYAVLGSLTTYFGGSAFPTPPSNLLEGMTIAIPSVAGQTPEAAKALLESLGFMVTMGPAAPSSLPVGVVATTDPAPGTKVSKGYNVTIFTSDGSQYVQMPDLIGDDASTTKAALVALGYSAGNITYKWVLSSDPAPYCKVTATDPAAGTPSSKTDPVTISVSTDHSGTRPTGCNP